jgi:hypothetical protein
LGIAIGKAFHTPDLHDRKDSVSIEAFPLYM